MFKFLKNEEGFSLIEMAIALIILTVMAAAVYMATEQLRTDSRIRSSHEQMAQVKTALEVFEGKFSGYPTSLAQSAFTTYLTKAPSATEWTYVCDATSARLSYTAADNATATLVGAEWEKVIPTGGVTVLAKVVTGIIKNAPTCIP
jgi:prepilin-type N-terminal cleavage/methylation domain-containing protein